MSYTDKNWFDDYLKIDLRRDIIFRALLALLVACAATAITLNNANASNALHYFKRFSEGTFSVINYIGLVALFLSLPALAFKNLEACASSQWGYDTKRGRWGGGMRRVAGELMLWTANAIASVLGVSIVVLYIVAAADAGTWQEWIGGSLGVRLPSPFRGDNLFSRLPCATQVAFVG